MILLEHTNKYVTMDKEKTMGFSVGCVSIFSNMYNIGDNGEYISNIEIISDGDNDRVFIQMNIEKLTNSKTLILAEHKITYNESMDKHNLSIIESFKKLEKYREELLKAINKAIHETRHSGVYKTVVITIGEPDFDTGEYNIMLRYSD